MVDQLDLFKKKLQSFVRLYKFLSQIIPYEDGELEQLCVYAKHLYPLPRIDRLDEPEMDVGELQLTHYRVTKRAEHQLKLSEESVGWALWVRNMTWQHLTERLGCCTQFSLLP